MPNDMTQQNDMAKLQGPDLANAIDKIPEVAMAKMLARAENLPRGYRENPGSCLVALQMARATGLGFLPVVQNLVMIDGNAAWKSPFVIAMIKTCGLFRDIDFIETHDDNKKKLACRMIATRVSDGRVLDGMTVTLDLAKSEGWMGRKGSKWQTMPDQMLDYKAAQFFARKWCPEVTCGLYTVDDIADANASRDLVATAGTAETDKLDKTKKRKATPAKETDVDPASTFVDHAL